MRGGFKPNSNGVLVRTRSVIKSEGQVVPYLKPINSFLRIDGLLAGDLPRIAITRKHGGIGDVLMTLPTVKAIAKKYRVKIDYGTAFKYLDGALPAVLEGNPYIDHILNWEDIDPDSYHVVADLTCPCVAHEKPLAKPINRIDLFAAHLGLVLDDHTIDYVISPEETKWAKDYIYKNNLMGKTLVLVQPTSTATARDAPHEKMKQALLKLIAQKKNVRALILTHDSDTMRDTNWKYDGFILAHELRVRQIAALMRETHLVLCPDSAILHIAAALHHPTVTLFGPTDPRARVNYHPEAVAIWGGKELLNYPCWYDVPNDNYMCWKRLEVDMITEVMLSVLEKKPLPECRDLVFFGPYLEKKQLYQIV